jgi:hypothetical protein
MEENMLPLMYISSEYKGLVKINESVAGETGSSVITTPVTPNGTFYLSFYPLENPRGRMLMPFTRRMSIGKNMELLADDLCMEVCVWPDNIYEVDLKPPFYFMPSTEEVYYSELVFFEFTMGSRQYAAAVVRDFNCYVLIEDAVRKRTVYACPLPFEVESAKMSLNRIGETPYLLADGACEKGAYVLMVALKPEMKLVACETCDAYEAGPEGVRVSGMFGRNEYKTARHYGLAEDGGICLLKEEPEIAGKAEKTDEDTVKEFLFCMKNNMQERAMEYLSLSLKDGLGYSDLKEFFGEFEATAAPLTVSRDCRDTVYALKYRTSGNIYNARLFCFDLYAARDGRYLIDNIKEP